MAPVQEPHSDSTNPPTQPDPYLKEMMDRITKSLQRPPEQTEVEPTSKQHDEAPLRQKAAQAPAPRPHRVSFGRD